MTKKKHNKEAELTDALQRLQAEFENYKKRTAKECASTGDSASADVISRFLPVIDSFELAKKNVDGVAKEGIDSLYNQFLTILTDVGLEVIDTKGKFDPHMHEALLTEESETEKNMIIEELQKGFTFKGRVLRHSKVKVSR